MSRVTLRPTIPADLAFVIGEPLPYRIRALTAIREEDGAVLGIGGLAFPPGGPVIVFSQINEEARRYPVALHKTGLAVMAMVRDAGVVRAVATTDADSPGRARWLRRLGFREAGPECQIEAAELGKIVFVWERDADVQ